MVLVTQKGQSGAEKTTFIKHSVDPNKPVDPRDLEINQQDEIHFPLPGYEILVANLFRGARRSWILEEFKKYGPITELRICITRKHSAKGTNQSGHAGYECRGWALIRYLRREDAEAAQRAKDGWAYAAPNTISRTIRVLPTDDNRTLYCAGFPKDWDRAKLQEFLEEQGVRGLAQVDLVESRWTGSGPGGGKLAFLTFEDRAAAVAAKAAHGVGPDNVEPSPNMKANPVLPDEGGAKLRLPYEGPGGAAGAEQLREDAEGWLVHAGEGAGAGDKDAPAAAGWWTEERRRARTEQVEGVKTRSKQPYRDVPAEELSELDRANIAYWAVRGMITGPPADVTHEALAAAPPPPQPLVVPATGERLLVHFADPLRLHAHLNNGQIVTKLTKEQQKDLDRRMLEQKQRKRLKLQPGLVEFELPPGQRGGGGGERGGGGGARGRSYRPDQGFPAHMVNEAGGLRPGGFFVGGGGGPGGPGRGGGGRRFPGDMGPERRFSGDMGPDRRFPGDMGPERRFPGAMGPERRFPGGMGPDRRFPGDMGPERRFHGDMGPERRFSGGMGPERGPQRGPGPMRGTVPGNMGPPGNFNHSGQGAMMPHGNRMMPQGNNMMHQNNGGPPMGMMGNGPSNAMHQSQHELVGGANFPGGGGRLTAISSQLGELMQSTQALEARLQGIQVPQQQNQPQPRPGAHAPQQWGPSLQHQQRGVPPPAVMGGQQGGVPPPAVMGGQQGGVPPPAVMGGQQGLPPPQQHMQQVGARAVPVVRYQPGGGAMQPHQQQQQQQPIMQQQAAPVTAMQQQQQPQQHQWMQQGQSLTSATAGGGAAVQQQPFPMQQQQRHY